MNVDVFKLFTVIIVGAVLYFAAIGTNLIVVGG